MLHRGLHHRGGSLDNFQFFPTTELGKIIHLSPGPVDFSSSSWLHAVYSSLLCPQQYKESQKDQGGYYPCLAYVGSKSLKSCPALCNSMGCNLPDSPVHGILQARILEWVTVPSSRDLLAPPGKPIHALLLLLSRFTHVRLCATPQTAAYRASPSLGFSRQEHWRGLPFPSPMHESEK